MQHSRVDWEFYGKPTDCCLAYTKGCYWPRGKLLGGSHGLNVMLYFRGNPRDYDRWEELGNPTWNWKTALRYFKKSENNTNPIIAANRKYHSTRGKLFLSDFDYTDAFSEQFIAAGVDSGYKRLDDLNADEYLGFGNLQGTVYDGRRQTTAKTFLTPSAKRRQNIHVIKDALVTKILIKDKHAVGVKFIYKGQYHLIAKSRKEVILSAGTISSAQLLLLSGIGPKRHLKRLGIPVKRNLAVGRNLQDHCAVPLYFQFRRSNPTTETPNDQTIDAFKLAVHNSGPLVGVGAANTLGVINSLNDSRYPDCLFFYYHYNANSNRINTSLSVLQFDDAILQEILKQNKEAEVGGAFVILLNPESRGKIELRSASIHDKPLIYPNYLQEEADVETLLRCVKQHVALTLTQTYRQNEAKLIRLPLPACDCFEYLSDDYYRCLLTQLSSTFYHPVGTSKMGPVTDPDAVVDYQLRVKGIKNLRQIDAGIMPLVPSANTNAGTIMVAERGADFVKWYWKRRERQQNKQKYSEFSSDGEYH